MNFDQVLTEIRQRTWPIEQLSETTARSSFKGPARKRFGFLIHLDKNFLALAVVPYVQLPLNTKRARALMNRLLHLNREINFAKFSVDEDGDVVLSVECRAAELARSELRDALDVLAYYADAHWLEISSLAACDQGP
jgi:hypothetical protein